MSKARQEGFHSPSWPAVVCQAWSAPLQAGFQSEEEALHPYYRHRENEDRRAQGQTDRHVCTRSHIHYVLAVIWLRLHNVYDLTRMHPTSYTFVYDFECIRDCLHFIWLSDDHTHMAARSPGVGASIITTRVERQTTSIFFSNFHWVRNEFSAVWTELPVNG